MSENKMVTKEDLKEFYNRIYPYLGGSAAAGFTPVGTIISVMGNHAPANYLICDGTVYNIADYPELANYFYNEFGSKNKFGGNGTTTFAVPDLRGEFVRGTGTNSHANQGRGANVGVHQDASAIPNSWVSASDSKIALTGNTTNIVRGNNKDSSYNVFTGATQWVYTPTGTKSAVGDDITDVYTVRPTNTSVLLCVASKNIYLDARFDYSLEEKVVGEWIDGSDLYQRTFELDNPTDQSVIATGISSIVSFELAFKDANGNQTVANSAWFSDAENFTFRIQKPASGNNMIIRVTNNTSAGLVIAKVYVTVRYTKTT